MRLRTKTMRLLPITLLFVASASAQDPKTFYERLPTAQATQALYQEALSVSDQIAKLPKGQVEDLLPLVFVAIKSDPDGLKHSPLGLYTISRRPDSGEVLKPYINDIRALRANPHPAFNPTAAVLFTSVH